MKRFGFVILLVAVLAVAIGVTAQLTAPRQLTAADRHYLSPGSSRGT